MLSRLMTRREQFVLLAVAVALAVGSGVLYVTRASASRGPAIQEAAPETGLGRAFPREPTPPIPEAPVPEATNVVLPGPVPEPRTVKVSVRGAVERPGVYSLDSDARIQDLLEKAGGAREEADLTDINLAAPLIDGTTLTVPARPSPVDAAGPYAVVPAPFPTMNPPEYTVSGWQSAGGSAAGTGEGVGSTGSGPGTGKVDLNRATAQELEALPGIGPKLAQEIIRYRAHMPFGRVEDLIEVSGIGEKKLEALLPHVTVE